jgi:hypothetical protein
MNLALAPSARYMILCDEVLRDEQRQGKLMIVGLTSLVNWPEGATTAVHLERLVVLLILTDGYGAGMGRIVCVNEATGIPIFAFPPRQISFEGKDPSGYYGVTFNLLDVRFPAPEVYVVQFFFNDTLVDEKLLTVREK